MLCYCKRRNSLVWFIYFLQPCEPQRIFIVFSDLNNTFGLLLASLSQKVFKCLMNVKVFRTTLGIKYKLFFSHAPQFSPTRKALGGKNPLQQYSLESGTNFQASLGSLNSEKSTRPGWYLLTVLTNSFKNLICSHQIK